MAQRPTITLTTDFGSNDHFVGTMKGVILDIVPDAQIVDICHAVQAFDVLDGALDKGRACWPSAPTNQMTPRGRSVLMSKLMRT